SSVYCIRLQPASPTLFPYTPLFRSTGRSGAGIPGGPDGPRPARFRRGGINTRPDLGDPIDRKAALAGVFADQVGIGSDVDAADPVIGGVALHPLDLRTQSLEHIAGLPGNAVEFLRRKLAGAGDLPFDEVLGHEASLASETGRSLAQPDDSHHRPATSNGAASGAGLQPASNGRARGTCPGGPGTDLARALRVRPAMSHDRILDGAELHGRMLQHQLEDDRNRLREDADAVPDLGPVDLAVPGGP